MSFDRGYSPGFAVVAAPFAYASVEQLAAALRIRVTAENTPALQLALDSARIEIDQYLDRPATSPLPTPTPPSVVLANTLIAVDHWKAADAAFGVIGFDQIGAIRVSPDQIARHLALLTPYKLQWGIA